MPRIIYIALCYVFGSCAWAGTIGLTQAQFKQALDAQTRIVNETKTILDGEQPSQDVELQKKAFCERLAAYREIAKLSRENPQLDQAYLMGVIANRYLDRQKQSMNASGMTEQYFCGPNAE